MRLQSSVSGVVRNMQSSWRDNLSVLYENQGDIVLFQNLANRLDLVLVTVDTLIVSEATQAYLTWRDGCLMLLDKRKVDKPGLVVDIGHRAGEKHSWPMAKSGAFAQAIGKKTLTVVDATAGWGQDSLAMFRMGYQVTSIERNPIMAELLTDAYQRLGEQRWVKALNIPTPKLVHGDAIQFLEKNAGKPDCIYLDPMFPPKRKKSALAKKAIMILRDLVGDDDDKILLFEAALKVAGKRVVVKCPDYAEPLGGKPSEIFRSKLIRYDVYIK